RATGQGVSYNAGRIFAAFGALYAGVLVAAFSKAEGGSMASAYAQMGGLITLIYIVGMITIWFAPETRGKPLPE
ncbi:MAG: MFS transporter, partial [Limisphaerales bacterium]